VKKAKCPLTDRTGELWERYLNDKYDAVWLVIGPPEGDTHPCLTLVGDRAGEAERRVENVGKDARQIWEDCPWLRRLM